MTLLEEFDAVSEEAFQAIAAMSVRADKLISKHNDLLELLELRSYTDEHTQMMATGSCPCQPIFVP